MAPSPSLQTGPMPSCRPGDDTESGTWAITDGILTGEGQPASKVTIEGDSLSLGDPEGNGRVETFNRCPA